MQCFLCRGSELALGCPCMVHLGFCPFSRNYAYASRGKIPPGFILLQCANIIIIKINRNCTHASKERKRTPRFRSLHSVPCQGWQGMPWRWAYCQRLESSDKQSELPMLTYTVDEALQILFFCERDCTENLARLLFGKLYSSITIISMTSSPGSSGKLGIAYTWFLNWRFWVICIHQNHWTIIFAYSFLL